MGINDGGYGIGRIVEAVDEFETECDQQRDTEQEKGQVGRSLRVRRGHVDKQAIAGEEQSRDHYCRALDQLYHLGRAGVG